MNEGVNLLKFPQRIASYNEPCRMFERAVIEGRLAHNNNPVLRWMISNCVVHQNGAGYMMPDRKKSRDKIDGIPACVMAIGAEMVGRAENGPSVYETRGMDD
jgi:phage terminase large subunit-like protein